jgi:hypothetical protein
VESDDEAPSEPRPTHRTSDVRCEDASAIATLHLVTPWGARTTATPSADGVAVFDVDWTDERIAAQPDAQLAAAWQVTTEAGLAFAWMPAADEQASARELIAKGRERVVVGGSPPALRAELVATSLTIGGGSELTLRIENTGASTAVGVTAKTRSSVAVLHGLVFTFDKIHPGKTASRTHRLAIPDGTRPQDATLLVTFTEAAGHAPADLTHKLALVRSICPGGKLTRAQYDDKRAKLKKSLDAGELSIAEFDRFDGELLRCLE